jgi:hypothetical protein
MFGLVPHSLARIHSGPVQSSMTLLVTKANTALTSTNILEQDEADNATPYRNPPGLVPTLEDNLINSRAANTTHRTN